MTVVFAGTHEFAAVALRALHEAGFEIPLVLTQPDRPAGRGMQLQASSVKQYALAHGMPVAQPLSLRMDAKDPERAAQARAAHEQLQSIDYDVMVVAAYGLILPRSTLDIRPCINIHGSLLPRWRGAAPIHRAIESGDLETGVTIMEMEEGLDTGPMLTMERLPIDPLDTTGSLHDKLAALGGRMIVDALRKMQAGELTAVPQPDEGATYAAKIGKEEAKLDFSLPAAGPVTLSIYDGRGRLIRTLVAEELPAGPRQVRWDGRDSRGQAVASGVYHYELRTDDRQLSRKLTLVR